MHVHAHGGTSAFCTRSPTSGRVGVRGEQLRGCFCISNGEWERYDINILIAGSARASVERRA